MSTYRTQNRSNQSALFLAGKKKSNFQVSRARRPGPGRPPRGARYHGRVPGNIGLLEIAIVLVIALIVFGPKRLPELGRSLGRRIREFRGSLSGDDEDERDQASREIEPGEGGPVGHKRS